MGRRPRLTRAQAVRLAGAGMVLDAAPVPRKSLVGAPVTQKPAGPPPGTTPGPESAGTRVPRVLGLDLAMGTTGWCLLVGGRPTAHGTFALPERRRNELLAGWLGRRAAELGRQVALLGTLHRPGLVAFEYPDTYRRAWSGGSKGREFEVMQALGRAQGFLVALWPTIGGGARLVAVGTSAAKRAVTGRVDANKDQVRYHLALARGWDLAGWGYDETDAAAVALAAWEGVA